MSSEILYSMIREDFGINGLGLSGEAPHDWPSSKESRVEEEVIETLLFLHLPVIAAEPMTVLSRDDWAGADITAIDSFGRIHLFEVKKAAVNKRTVEQLTHYLLSHLFENPEKFLEERHERYSSMLGDRLALYFAGAYSGLRTSTLGRKFVSEWPNGLSVMETNLDLRNREQWDNLAEPRRTELLMRSLIRYAVEKRGLIDSETPSVEGLRDLSNQWSERLPLPADSTPPVFMPARSGAVVWLVGESIDDPARDQIRLWRRAGIDARWLSIEVRRMYSHALWHLRIERELAPDRDGLTKALRKWTEDNQASVREASVSFDLYHRSFASDPRLSEGSVIKTPSTAIIRLSNGKKVKISS